MPVELSDADVETVIRTIVLSKKPDKVPAVQEVVTVCSGEIARPCCTWRRMGCPRCGVMALGRGRRVRVHVTCPRSSR